MTGESTNIRIEKLKDLCQAYCFHLNASPTSITEITKLRFGFFLAMFSPLHSITDEETLGEGLLQSISHNGNHEDSRQMYKNHHAVLPCINTLCYQYRQMGHKGGHK